ncbi:11587_t:CDS:2 [Funneliformis geosporum]|uniref:11587_t:CDS:1 n=1 Tax=Funneliformis geosporum TaxID=1117311 RepID=A0A9W4SB49_9GLOM|nr:11587_t:CDS:2 [Funneliformis geosporum]
MSQRTAQVGSSEKLTVHLSKEYNCSYIDNMKKEKEVLEYIAQILQA